MLSCTESTLWKPNPSYCAKNIFDPKQYAFILMMKVEVFFAQR